MDFPVDVSDSDWAEFARNLASNDRSTNDFQHKFHLEWTVRGHRIREAIADDHCLTRLLRFGLPAYFGETLTLYRGENLDRWKAGVVGFCWTDKQETARMFGRGLQAVASGGVLLRTVPPVEAIIAGPSQHSHFLNESEYTVEPALLDRVIVVEQFEALT